MKPTLRRTIITPSGRYASISIDWHGERPETIEISSDLIEELIEELNLAARP